MASRACLGVDLLRKEMLAYELKIREESSEGTVEELSSRLRAALDKPIRIPPMDEGEVTACLQLLNSLMQGLSNSLSYLCQPTPKQVDRLRAHLTHLSNRIGDLRGLSLNPEVKGQVDKLSSDVSQLLGDVEALGVDKGGKQEKNSEASQVGGGGTEQTGARNLGSQQARIEGSPVITSSFANLPNPIMCLLRNIEGLSISTKKGVKQVLWLLADLEEHIGTFGVPVSVVWALLYPLGDSDFRSVIGKALREGKSLRQVRGDILQGELPFRWVRELEEEHLWRVQGVDESLKQYMIRVRSAFLALGVGMPEEQAVANVIEGLLPQHRTQLLVLGTPARWEQLINNMKQIERFSLIDEQRAGSRPTPFEGRSGREQEKWFPTGERTRRCFRCGSVDHLVRECPLVRRPREGK